MEYLPRQLSAFSCHKVAGHYGSQGNSVVIGTEITHNPYRAHIGQGCKILAQILIHTSLSYLLAIDSICFLNDLYLFCSYFTDNTDTQAWPWEWLTIYQIIWNTQLTAGLSYLILKQKTQRLYDFLEIYKIRQTAYIMVGLDYSRFTQTTFDNIWINSALYQEVYGTNLLGFFLKYANKLFTDNLTLLLWLFYTLQLFIESILHINPDKIQIIRAFWAKYSLNLISLILTEKAMIYKYAGELLANSLGHKNCCYRGINTAGQSTQSLAVANLFL